MEKKRIKTLQEDILKEELTDFIINCIIKINLHKKIKYAIVFMVKLEIIAYKEDCTKKSSRNITFHELSIPHLIWNDKKKNAVIF